MTTERRRAALLEAMPVVMSYIKTHTSLTWSDIARQLDMRYTHIVEVRRGERYIPATRTLLLMKLLAVHGLVDGLLDHIERNPGVELDMTKGRRQALSLAKLRTLARSKGLF